MTHAHISMAHLSWSSEWWPSCLLNAVQLPRINIMSPRTDVKCHRLKNASLSCQFKRAHTISSLSFGSLLRCWKEKSNVG